MLEVGIIGLTFEEYNAPTKECGIRIFKAGHFKDFRAAWVQVEVDRVKTPYGLRYCSLFGYTDEASRRPRREEQG